MHTRSGSAHSRQTEVSPPSSRGNKKLKTTPHTSYPENPPEASEPHSMQVECDKHSGEVITISSSQPLQESDPSELNKQPAPATPPEDGVAPAPAIPEPDSVPDSAGPVTGALCSIVLSRSCRTRRLRKSGFAAARPTNF